MGSVTLVERKADKKQFASKKQLSSSGTIFRLAVKELEMLQKLDHPNIVNFIQSFYSL